MRCRQRRWPTEREAAVSPRPFSPSTMCNRHTVHIAESAASPPISPQSSLTPNAMCQEPPSPLNRVRGRPRASIPHAHGWTTCACYQATTCMCRQAASTCMCRRGLGVATTCRCARPRPTPPAHIAHPRLDAQAAAAHPSRRSTSLNERRLPIHLALVRAAICRHTSACTPALVHPPRAPVCACVPPSPRSPRGEARRRAHCLRRGAVPTA